MIVDNFDILFYNLNEAREFQILRLLQTVDKMVPGAMHPEPF